MSVEAGPVERSVLYLQESHISNVIQSDNLDHTLRVRRSDNLIWDLWKSGVLHRRVRSCLNEMGFYGILCCGDCIYDNHLITALVERWRRETHTFHLRCGETTITLQDVALIWGLNVDGEPIIGTDVSQKFGVWQRICFDWLGFMPVESDFRSNTIKLTSLHAHCMQTMINDYSPEVQVQQYTRCVALMIIGGCMLPDSEGCVVKMLYLPFLREISRVRSYSWASAVLAFLYRELCGACMQGKHEIAGPLYILQIWAWSRMTPLCPDRLGYNLIAPHENPNYSDNVLPIPPYGARWKHAYCWTHTPTHSVRIIRDVLDRMGDSQFNWVIYDLGAPDISSLPIECRNPMLWRSVCPLICFHIVEWHRPNRVLRQFAMLQHIPGPALDGDKLHEVSRRGRPNFDWANHHRVFVDAWADRHNLVVETEYAVNFCMTDEYARWYDLITRRFVSPIDPVQVDSGYQPGDAYFRRVVRDGTSTIANICKGVAIEDLSREDLVEALTKSIATAAFLHELTLKTPQQQQHQARTSTRRRQGRGDNRRIGDDLQSFDTPDWRQSTSQTPLTSVSHQTSSGADVGPTFRDVGPSYVFSSPLSSSFFDFSQGSGGNDQEDQRTEHQQSDFQTPPAYTTYQDSFIEGIFGGISHQYGGEHQTFDTSPVPYIGYSLPDSTAASASQVPPEYVVEREDEDDYQAPNIIRRSRRVPRAPDCGTGHRLGHRFGQG